MYSKICIMLFVIMSLVVAQEPQSSVSEGGAQARLADTVSQTQQDIVQNIIAKALKSFVFIEASGSGVIISEDGYILTNDHVAGGGAEWRVRTTDGTIHHADLVGTDPYGDIALLKIRDGKNLPFIEFADSDALNVGETVIAVGNPFGMGNLDERPTVTIGLISALHRFHYNYTDAIMTDAPLNPGNSGGPLITIEGKLAGINGQIDSRFETRTSSGIGYAVSSNQIKLFLDKLKQADGGFVYHGYIAGVATSSIWSEDRKTIIKEIRQNSEAYKAGLRKDDEVIEIEGKKIYAPTRFYGVVRSYPANSVLNFKVIRAGKEMDFKIQLGSYPLVAVGQASLKITFYPTRDALQSNLRVNKVHPGTPAFDAGIQPGDIIMSFTGRRITSGVVSMVPDILERWFRSYAQAGGALAELTVIRDRKEITVPIEIKRDSQLLGIDLNKNVAKNDQKTPNALDELIVLSVEKGLFADRAGLKRGDVIAEFSGQKLKGRQHFYNILKRSYPGTKTKMKIMREGKLQEIEITLGLQRAFDDDGH